jgi:hypothetical protein
MAASGLSGDGLMRPPMSESDLTPKPQSLIFRIEISAEQASALAPIFSGAAALPPVPASTPAAPTPTPAPTPMSDQAIDSRVLELEERERELAVREAEFQLHEDKMDSWRTELEELEQTLERREKDLVSYVDQLQGAMASPSTDTAWWQRPAGGDGGVY